MKVSLCIFAPGLLLHALLVVHINPQIFNHCIINQKASEAF